MRKVGKADEAGGRDEVRGGVRADGSVLDGAPAADGSIASADQAMVPLAGAAAGNAVSAGRRPARASRTRLALYHTLLLGGLFVFWYVMTEPGLLPNFYFDDP